MTGPRIRSSATGSSSTASSPTSSPPPCPTLVWASATGTRAATPPSCSTPSGCARTAASSSTPRRARSSAGWSGTAAPKPRSGWKASCTATGTPNVTCASSTRGRATSSSSFPAKGGSRRSAGRSPMSRRSSKSARGATAGTSSSSPPGRCWPRPPPSSTAADHWRRVWHSISHWNELPKALTELPGRRDLEPAEPALALGRRWRHDQPDFWERLSPLHRRPGHAAPAQENTAAADAAARGKPLEPAGAGRAIDPGAEAFHEQLQRLRQAEFDEIQSGLAGAHSVRAEASSRDLRPSGVDGLMPDPEDDLDDEEGSWL
jgi:hypothetical protein